MTIINVPIESLEERYSAQWNRWIPEYFAANMIDYITIDPEPLTDVIRSGQFLDVIGTNYYKAKQLAEICRLIDCCQIGDGDTFFFNDLWFPGIEMLFYIRDALEMDFKITGILHAGCYDPYDFLSSKRMGRWGAALEQAWFSEVDTIFVATNFHKELVTRHHHHVSQLGKKVEVTGLPFYWERPQSLSDHRENIVVFPHRLAEEKNPELFDHYASILSELMPDWQFIKTKDVCSTKEEYYQLLERSKIAVSFANQETWGIAMQEAVAAGCVPLCPSKLSYPELFFSEHLYSNEKQNHFLDKLLKMMCETKYLDFTQKYQLAELQERICTSGKQALANIAGHFDGN